MHNVPNQEDLTPVSFLRMRHFCVVQFTLSLYIFAPWGRFADLAHHRGDMETCSSLSLTRVIVFANTLKLLNSKAGRNFSTGASARLQARK